MNECRHYLAVADAERLPLPDRSVDLTVGSPPYTDCRTYDDGTLPPGRSVAMGVEAWIDWMLRVTAEALRVTRGPVIWIANGKTEDRNYWPACEGLMYRWWQLGGSSYRPVAWVKTDNDDGGCGTPGSGGTDWFRADWEYCMAFKRKYVPYARGL